MESPIIGISFSGLKKKIENRPEYYIDILPQISSLKNIENLNLNEKDDSNAYSFTVVYKIILKKTMPLENYNNNKGVKVYYSCVDLLPSVSETNIDFASGDVFTNMSNNGIQVVRSMTENTLKLITTRKKHKFVNDFTKEDNKFDKKSSWCRLKHLNTCDITRHSQSNNLIWYVFF